MELPPSTPIAWTCQVYRPAANDAMPIRGSLTVMSMTGAAKASSCAIWTRYVAAPITGYQLSVAWAPRTAPSIGRRTPTWGTGFGAPGVANGGG